MPYLLRRLITSLLVVLGVITITFAVARIVPSDPASLYAGPRARPAQVEQVRADLNLDAPITTQYTSYLGDLAQGDLGISFASKRPIFDDIVDLFPATLELALLATLVSMLLGIPLGVIAASRRNRPRDGGLRLFAMASVSVPVFWAALLLQLFLASRLGWLPLSGRTSPDVLFDETTGFFLIDSALSGSIGNVWDVVRHLILPVTVMAAYPTGLTLRLIRGSMIDVLNEPYIEAARLAGIAERTVLYRLALKNALAPALTILGLTFAYSISSAFLVEVVFNWPGIGSYLTNAIVRLDFPVITAAALVVTVVYVMVNLLLDLVHAKIDPRVVLS